MRQTTNTCQKQVTGKMLNIAEDTRHEITLILQGLRYLFIQETEAQK